MKERNASMKNRKLVVITFAFLALSAMLVAAQMQMPSSETKPEKSSATQKTLTGIVSDSMCGAHYMARTRAPLNAPESALNKGRSTRHLSETRCIRSKG